MWEVVVCFESSQKLAGSLSLLAFDVCQIHCLFFDQVNCRRWTMVAICVGHVNGNKKLKTAQSKSSLTNIEYILQYLLPDELECWHTCSWETCVSSQRDNCLV